MAGPPLVDSSNANMKKKEEKTVDQPCPKRRRKSIDEPAATAAPVATAPTGATAEDGEAAVLSAAVPSAVATEEAEGAEEERPTGGGSEVDGVDGDDAGGAEEEERDEEEEEEGEEQPAEEIEEEGGEGGNEEGDSLDVSQAPETGGSDEGENGKPDGSKIARARSAWMLFLADNREKVRKEHPGLAVGPMQKILSAMWKGLGEEEVARYAKLAAEDKERMKKELAAAGLTKLPAKNSDSGASSAVSGGPTSLVLPLARVRKAVRLDPAVGNISKEGLLLVTKATEVFMAVMAEHAWNIGKQTGRKSVRPSDVADFVFAAPEMYWLKDEFRDERSSVKKKQGKPEASGAKAADAKGAKKAAVVMKGAKSITSFFQKA